MLRIGIATLRDRLPGSWRLDTRAASEIGAGMPFDAELRLTAPDASELVLLVEAKRLVNTRDVPAIIEELGRLASSWDGQRPAMPMVMARYLPPTTRERIAGTGAAYADATGNLLLACEQPAPARPECARPAAGRVIGP